MFKAESISYEINYKELTLDKKIGEGGFGVVYKGVYRHSNVAVKQLLMENISQEAADEFASEAVVMAKLRYENIVQFYGYCVSPQYCIVMEYMPHGSLFNVLRSDKPLDWPERFRIAVDIAKGVSVLHYENILHRDIKSLNVLLDEHYKAKLTDFGLSKIKTETKSKTLEVKTQSEAVGTLAWMAPELFEATGVYTQKSDIYSLGITFWELATSKIPFAHAHGDRQSLIPGWVRNGAREQIPEDCPKPLADLIQACWATEPKQRPTAEDIVTRLKSVNDLFTQMNSPSSSISSSSSTSLLSASAASGPRYVMNSTMGASSSMSSGSISVGSPIRTKNSQSTDPEIVLKKLKAFFMSEDYEGEETGDLELYNQVLENHNAYLVYAKKKQIHTLYVNDKRLEPGDAIKVITEMIKSVVLESVSQKIMLSSILQPVIHLGPSSENNSQTSSPVITFVQKTSPSEQENSPQSSLQVKANNLKTMSLIEAIKQNNQEEFFRLLNLKRDKFGKKVIDEVDMESEGSPLYWAAFYGYVHFIDPLVQAGADVNKPDKKGYTPVCAAAKNGHVAAICALRAVDADFTSKTPVYLAAENGYAEAITVLKGAGATMHEKAIYIAAQNGHAAAITALKAAGATVYADAVYVAAQNGQAAAITALKTAGANMDTLEFRNGETPVWIAARSGHAAVITALKAAGANVNKPKDSKTPVYIAAENGHAEAIRALKAADANVDTPDKDGETPVWVAARSGHAAVITALKAAGANVNKPKDSKTPVYIAAENGHAEAIRALKAADANVDTPDKDGETPVWVAARSGHAAVITALKAAGANVNTLCTCQYSDGKSRNRTLCTPVWIAAKNGHAEAIRALKAAGANVDTPDKGAGVTPVFISAYFGHAEAIHALKASGANVDMSRGDGVTPVSIAAANGEAAAIAALHAVGVNVNTPDNNGKTPVYIAAQRGRAKAITALKVAGANVDTPDKDGKTPLYIAVEHNRAEVITALLNAGADASIKTSSWWGTTALEKAKEKVKEYEKLRTGQHDSFGKEAIAGYREVIRLLEAHFKQYPKGVKPLATMNAGLVLSIKSSNASEQKGPPVLAQFNHSSISSSSSQKGQGDTCSASRPAAGLIEAIKQNNQEEVFRLLALKTDHSGKKFIDEVDLDREGSPLYWAAECGYIHFIGMLLKAGADINKPTKNGATPVYVAAFNGHAPAIAALHVAGANVNTSNKDGATPVYVAAFNGHASAITALHAADANVNTARGDSDTPLCAAARNGYALAVSALLEAGADCSLKTKWGTALEQAKRGKEAGYREVVKVLEEHLQRYPNGIKATEARKLGKT
jgi:ankyrin repeat protein/serine/threonine protein kinase